MSILDDVPQILADAMGDLLFYDGRLLRDTKGTGPAYDPGKGMVQNWSCKVLATGWKDSAKAAGLVSVLDRKLLILAATIPGVTPQEGDRLVLKQGTFRISSDGGSAPAVQVDPANACWVCRGRN